MKNICKIFHPKSCLHGNNNSEIRRLGIGECPLPPPLPPPPLGAEIYHLENCSSSHCRASEQNSQSIILELLVLIIWLHRWQKVKSFLIRVSRRGSKAQNLFGPVIASNNNNNNNSIRIESSLDPILPEDKMVRLAVVRLPLLLAGARRLIMSISLTT